MALTTTIMLVISLMALMFCVGRMSKKDVSVEDSLMDYWRGWDAAKRIYYTDMRADKLEEARILKEERDREYALMTKENMGYSQVSSELLMAYGVSSVGGLPKSVREAYNISDDQNSIDLESLIRREQEG